MWTDLELEWKSIECLKLVIFRNDPLSINWRTAGMGLSKTVTLFNNLMYNWLLKNMVQNLFWFLNYSTIFALKSDWWFSFVVEYIWEQFPKPWRVKGVYLSKALTCMDIFLYKQELLFCQGDGYFWPHCCMNNLYISHRSLYAPTYSFWAIGSMLISLFRVTSCFDSINNNMTRWMNFR